MILLSRTDIEDFLAGQETVTFEPGATRRCQNVTIVDDTTMEPLEEVFITTIDEILGPNPSDAVIGTNSMAPVTIVDDDSM